MNPVAPRDTLTPAEAAALRARIIADTARDRFAPTNIMIELSYIAALMDRAAEAFERNTPQDATEALNGARETAQLHPGTRFPSDFTHYVEAPISGVALPVLAPFNPVDPALAQRERDLRQRLSLVHEQLAQATSESATRAWLPSALAHQRDLMRLAGEVRADNARPCNQRQPEPAGAEAGGSHLKCPKCGSANVRPSAREWATCQDCRHGDLWSAFMTCDCFGYDCPALRG